MKQLHNFKLFLTVLLTMGAAASWSQTFVFDYTGDWISWDVPTGVTSINIEALGAQGASGQVGYVGGRGARMSGDFDVTPGETLIMVVGGRGQGQNSGSNGGGGGGTFVVRESPGSGYTIAAGPFAGTDVEPMIVAGGGGGTRASVVADGNPGVVGDQGTSGSCSGSSGGGVPTTAPEMGGVALCSSWGSGGAGFVGDGGNDGSSGCGGDSFLNGAAGGTGCGSSGDNAAGGFGGGGQGRGSWGGGGGGGWSGGQGSRVAGGGGSYNVGTSQDNESGFREEDGLVTIEVLCQGLDVDITDLGVCIGEEITITGTSMTGGTVSWDMGVMNGVPFEPVLGATTVTATSTSPDDCAYEVTVYASEVPDITANSSLPSACEGAIITLWGEGGLAIDDEEIYTWTATDGSTPIDSVGFMAAEGTVTYTVIGSYLGCEGPAAEVTLVGAPQPEVTGTATPEQVCLGETYVLTGGGDGSTSFDWGASIEDGEPVTQETVGTFAHMVVGFSDDGCTDTTFVFVEVFPTPIVDAGDDFAVCAEDDIVLSGSGAMTYTWDPAVTDGEAFPAVAGETTYTVTGTDMNGCSDDDEIVVTAIERPYVASAIVVDEYYGYDGSIDITPAGGSGDYTYSWSHGPTTEDVDGLTTGVIYTVTIDDITTDPGLCSGEESYALMRFIGIDENGESGLTAYPNPTNDEITITYAGAFNYVVISMNGEEVMTGNGNDNAIISMEELANGTYIVQVNADDKTNFIQIVKQ